MVSLLVVYLNAVCYLWIQAVLQVSVLRVHLNDQLKQPCLSTEAGISSLQKHPILYLLTISAFPTKHRAAHPHGVHQRPHKQARNKTGFVSWGRGAELIKRKGTALPASSLSDQPPKSNVSSFKSKESKSLKQDRIFKIRSI